MYVTINMLQVFHAFKCKIKVFFCFLPRLANLSCKVHGLSQKNNLCYLFYKVIKQLFNAYEDNRPENFALDIRNP